MSAAPDHPKPARNAACRGAVCAASPVHHLLKGFAGLLTALVLCPAAVAQGNALGVLNSILRQGQGGLSISGTPAQTPTPGRASGGDLIQMLSQSIDQIDEPREIEIGRQLAAVLLGSKPLHGDMRLQRYVNQLGRWISLQSTRPNLPWAFVVIDDPGFNAFAAPGGYVFVTKGLIDRVRDEAELAGILAHEITHVTSKHHLIALRAKAQAGVLTQLAASQLRNNLGGLVSAQLLALGRNLYGSGLDQQDEFDADRNGTELAARAGLDPWGLASVLQQLRTAAPEDPLFALSLSTHPPAQQRLDRIEAAVGTRLDALSAPQSVPLALRLAR
jgi:predicted Zn-dependent protease